MYCPFCGKQDTKVIDSRLASEGAQVRRRRECLACGERFTTFETAELVMPRIIKSNGAREPFNESKLATGDPVAGSRTRFQAYSKSCAVTGAPSLQRTWSRR